ncbi:hypothetical protein JDV02_006970 [Purpureocillium takamizusanense]|uniref:Uncharacterized protein n=1 Tax=Purpureocillium takamizusanense TaxID=2060973 RepID=A0A9Q8QLG5_9HYPO|nr:uncharacterized protein JDV02_006970 [Purpureocillium takamizusanense]UNI20924.1 hypothetical protein JDV02_006970 [Purpureocillium takamizusanense]
MPLADWARMLLRSHTRRVRPPARAAAHPPGPAAQPTNWALVMACSFGYTSGQGAETLSPHLLRKAVSVGRRPVLSALLPRRSNNAPRVQIFFFINIVRDLSLPFFNLTIYFSFLQGQPRQIGQPAPVSLLPSCRAPPDI